MKNINIVNKPRVEVLRNLGVCVCKLLTPGFRSTSTLGLMVLLFASMLPAAEITSTGNGDWMDPATWRGGKVPEAGDDVFIRKFDIISFNRPGDDKVTCQKLQIDPKGVLQFKAGAGKCVFSAGDVIDCLGVIKIDGSKNATDAFELRLVGPTQSQRVIKLGKGAGLLMYGKTGLADGKRNVGLSVVFGKDEKEPPAGLVDTVGQGSVDLQWCWFKDVKIFAQKIDNTGAKPNERINVLDSVFTGQARVSCKSCDTPIVNKNTFDYPGTKELAEPAIDISYSALAEVKQNTIRGFFHTGIAINYQGDATIFGNTIERCSFGVRGGYGIPSTTIQKTLIRDCVTGLKLEGGSGVVEDVTIDKAFTGLVSENSQFQVTNLVVNDLDKKGFAVTMEASSVDLLNCNIVPEQIKMTPVVAAAIAKVVPEIALRCQQYVIVKVTDAPADCQIDLRTSDNKLAADIADPNIRNTPAPVTEGMTPLPATLNPLIVRTWSYDRKGVLVKAPEYTLKVLGPAPKEGERPVLKTQTFQPPANGFRPMPNDVTPTLEVKLK